ncbi:MAG TPA: hypothetical protein VFU58_06785 [Candidatus Nitrosotalea sp.]|nr:hypothetical protein [Candidatus Nitrosotalea sp.]
MDYLEIVVVGILTSILIISLWQFSTVKKEMRIQTQQQTYAKIVEARLNLEKTETFTKMAKESPLFAERFSVVDNPDEYYTTVAFLDLFEFLYLMSKTNTIEAGLWLRWNELIKTMMSIPKFKKVWVKTKKSHMKDFADFIDSLQS